MKKTFLMTGMLLSSVGLFAQEASAAAVINNLVPFIATMAVPILVVFFFLYYRYKENKAKIELAKTAIENGQTISEEFFKGMNEKQKRKKKSHLQNALECIGVGIGVAIMLWAIVEPRFATIGLFIFCIGISYLILHFIEKKQAKSNDENKPVQ